MKNDARILIVGQGGFVEQALMSSFQKKGMSVYSSSRLGLDTTIQPSVYRFFQEERPEYVILTSVLSGGIQANQDRGADFIYQNLESQNNIIYASWKFGVKKLLYVGASCMYPRDCSQPMKEEDFFSGVLEKTSEPYSLAKLSGLVMCQAFYKQYGLNAISLIPATIYGEHLDGDMNSMHVLNALLLKFQNAVQTGEKEVVVWGTGEARREFIHVDDFTRAVEFLFEKHDDPSPVNVGVGEDISIKELAELIASAVGFKGRIVFDSSKPDGAKQKLLDSSRINQIGWSSEVDLSSGIRKILERMK